LIIPPDSAASTYGFSPGLRARIASLGLAPGAYEVSSGKIDSADITMFVNAKMTSAEVTATLEYNLDLHLAGNRSPFVIEAHSHVYASNYTAPPAAPDYVERQHAIETFVAYALAKPGVRARPVRDIIAWMLAPVPLADAVRPEGGPGGGSEGGDDAATIDAATIDAATIDAP